jgi:glycosyltransferase involved in cell wall biosynthesis
MALLTLVPGRMGGSESYLRALLDRFARGEGPERVTLLVNEQAAIAYRDRARGPVTLHRIGSYRPGRRAPGRAAAILAAHALPRRTARQVPSGLELLHFPVTVPIPRTTLPEVVTLYDVQHHDLPGFFSPPERAIRRLTYDRAAQRARAVITSSRYSADRITEVLGIQPGRVHVIHSGIDHERFTPEQTPGDDRVRQALGLERPFVFYPANLWPHKNHDRMIRAFARVDQPDLELVLTGQTYGKLDRIFALGGESEAGKRIRHLGYVDAHHVPALYRSARAVVFPSLYEGFGGPPLEAMACGCPVAASMRASLAEVCGGAALPLDPESVDSIADGIERVVSDEQLRKRLKTKGVAQAVRFSWPHAAAQHLEVYRRVAR